MLIHWTLVDWSLKVRSKAVGRALAEELFSTAVPIATLSGSVAVLSERGPSFRSVQFRLYNYRGAYRGAQYIRAPPAF